MSTHDELEIEEHHHPNYLGVFIALAILTAVITAIELMSQAGVINWPRPVLNASYLTIVRGKGVAGCALLYAPQV